MESASGGVGAEEWTPIIGSPLESAGVTEKTAIGARLVDDEVGDLVDTAISMVDEHVGSPVAVDEEDGRHPQAEPTNAPHRDAGCGVRWQHGKVIAEQRPMQSLIAHVDYVTDPEPSPDPLGFLLDALGQPGALPILLIGLVVVLAALGAWARWRPLDEARGRLVERVVGYQEYLPWIVRLSVGLVLIGSGLSRVRFLPTLETGGLFALLLTATGFLLLVGLAVRPAALVALGAYVVTLAVHPEMVMMLDVAGGLGVAAILGPGRPSLDDLLRAAFPRGPGARAATENFASDRYDDIVPLLVRLGIGGAFAASGIVDKLLIYDQALAAVERYQLTSVLPVAAELWVLGAIVIETALGIAIILGVLTRFSAVIGFAVLTLTLFALPDDPVIAHVCLFGLSSMLVILGAGRWSLDRAVLAPLGARLRRS